MMKKIILASKSSYRKEQLAKLMIPFEVADSLVDEEILKQQILNPKLLSMELAQAKALSVYHEFPEALIIGADQLGFCEGRRLDKAGTKEKAMEQLHFLAGKTHTLYTSVCLKAANIQEVFCVPTHLKMRKLSNPQIQQYIELDHPIDCAGSYKIESYGISLFEEIITDDFTSIVGLPQLILANKFNELGIQVPGVKK